MSKTIKDLAGSVSPLYGIVSGRGAFGALSPLSHIIREVSSRRGRKTTDANDAIEDEPVAMRKGGSVSRRERIARKSAGGKVTRGDGIARRGHTKGKMR